MKVGIQGIGLLAAGLEGWRAGRAVLDGTAPFAPVAVPDPEAAQLPPIRAVDPKQVFCLQKPLLVLPVEGAPLVFSTGLAHDFAITVQNANGTSTELPAVAVAFSGLDK